MVIRTMPEKVFSRAGGVALAALFITVAPTTAMWDFAMAQTGSGQAPVVLPKPIDKAVVAPPSSPSASVPATPSVEQSTAGMGSAAAKPAIQKVGGEDALSPVGMFLHADMIVKGVMIGLGFASLVTWTVALMKILELASARRRARSAFSIIARASTLSKAVADLSAMRGPIPRFAAAVAAEADRSAGLPSQGVKDRAEALLARLELRAGRAMSRGTGFLATIGSTAPFVGLFGTVWGIMNSFIGISKSNTTNLAVVAPGIAEALLATATGLIAAIPAVVIYNMFARMITNYRASLGDASGEILRHLSRDLDVQAADVSDRKKDFKPLVEAAE